MIFTGKSFGFTRGAVLFVALFTLLFAGSPCRAAPHMAALQMHTGKFLTSMFTYAVPGRTEAFEEAERYMAEDTAQVWREWYTKWLKNAVFTKCVSEIELGAILISPKTGPRGEIRVRVPVKTWTTILGKDFESAGTIYVTYFPVEGSDGEKAMAVGIVRHESDEGGLFEVSPNGVKTKSTLGEKDFNKMVLDAAS